MLHRKILIPAYLLLSISAAAQTPSPSKAPAKKAAPAAKAPATAKATPFDPALLQPASLRAKAPEVYDVKFVTTAGDFGIKVTRAWAPQGAAFFRVLPGFMAQFGLSPYPEVSKAWDQANIKDDPVVQSNHRGFITYAMAGPNTRTTQVFINYGNNERLDRDGFSAFGMVTDGMEVVDKLYSGYGEGAPDGKGPRQDLIGTRGRAYLEQSFSKLDTIKTATLVPAAPKPPAGK
jgi:peptidyl-prolyl cis-trans isomerase A (cyclophilin A)